MSWSGFGDLDLSTVEAEQGRKTLTPGAHPCRVTSAELKATTNGHGIKVEFQALDGSGTTSDFINVSHKRSPDAERIGRQRLKALLIAGNHPNPNKPGDIRSLVGLRVGVHVVQSEDWVDKEGRKRPGGGKPRDSGAYYALQAGEQQAEDQAFTPSSGFGRGTYGDLDDGIPF